MVLYFRINRFSVFMILSLLLQTTLGWSADQIPAFPQKQPVALSNACIHPVSGAVIPKGTILFDNGKIVALGESLSVPSGTRLVDVAGRCVYPGFIAVNTLLGLMEITQESITHDIAENPVFSPNIQTGMAVNPDSELIPVTRSNGIALSLVSPMGQFIKGMSSIIQMDGWTNEDMNFKTPAALHIKWPSMKINRDKAAESKENRDKQLKFLNETFAAAKAYWKANDAAKKENREIPKTDIRYESLLPVLNKEIPVVVEANSIDEIQAAVSWAEEEGVRIIIENGHDAVKIADWLKDKQVPVIIQGEYSLELREQESYDYLYSLPAQLAEKGVRYCIGMGTNMEIFHVRNLPYLAGTAAAYGLSKEEAVKAITLYPAQLFGIDKRVGSLEVGKDATLIVTQGDPLDSRSSVEKMYIQGREVDMSNKQTMLSRKFRYKYQAMKEK